MLLVEEILCTIFAARINTLNFRLLTLCCLMPWLIAAQPGIEWDRTYGGNWYEEGNNIQKGIDGGFIISGMAASEMGFDVSQPNLGIGDCWIVKTDDLGNKLWDKRFGGTKLENIWWSIVTSDGNYLFVAESASDICPDKSSNSFGFADYWIVKMSPTGDIIWDLTVGGSGNDWPFCGTEKPNGDFLITGWSDSPVSGNKTAPNKGGWDMWTICVTPNGDLLWDKSYGGNNDEQVHYIYPTTDGNYFLGGSSTSNASGDVTGFNKGEADYWLVKIDPDGNIIWDKSYGGERTENIVSIAKGILGTYWLVGGSASPISGDKTTPNYGGEDFWIVQIDAEGTKIQEHCWGSVGLDKVYVGYQNQLGNILIGGLSLTTNEPPPGMEPGQGAYDFWGVFMKDDGTIIWNKKWGGVEHDAMTDFLFIPNDGFVLLGNSSSNIGFDKSENSRGVNDIWIIKLLCDFEVELGDSLVVCPGEEITLNAVVSNCDGCKLIWSNNNSGEFSNLVINESQTIKVTAFSENACEYSDTIDIVMRPPPTNAVFAFTKPTCTGFNDGTAVMVSADGLSPPFELLEDTLDLGNKLLWLAAGELQVHIKDSLGCVLDTIILVPEADPFTITLGNDTTIWLGDHVTINAWANQPIASYEWTDPELFVINPTVYPQTTTEYILLATSTKGCPGEAEKRITVRINKNYFAPNVFSPDHDGFNDYFTIFGGDGVAEIRGLRVYNRWGNNLFYLDDVWPADPEHGWNGDFRGEQQAPDVYTWFARLILFDGSEEIIGGTVTILR
jgi:gliding motility-associated-like protein